MYIFFLGYSRYCFYCRPYIPEHFSRIFVWFYTVQTNPNHKWRGNGNSSHHESFWPCVKTWRTLWVNLNTKGYCTYSKHRTKNSDNKCPRKNYLKKWKAIWNGFLDSSPVTLIISLDGSMGKKLSLFRDLVFLLPHLHQSRPAVWCQKSKIHQGNIKN